MKEPNYFYRKEEDKDIFIQLKAKNIHRNADSVAKVCPSCRKLSTVFPLCIARNKISD